MDGGIHAVNVNDQLRLAATSGDLGQIQDCLEAGAVFDVDAVSWIFYITHSSLFYQTANFNRLVQNQSILLWETSPFFLQVFCYGRPLLSSFKCFVTGDLSFLPSSILLRETSPSSIAAS